MDNPSGASRGRVFRTIRPPIPRKLAALSGDIGRAWDERDTCSGRTGKTEGCWPHKAGRAGLTAWSAASSGRTVRSETDVDGRDIGEVAHGRCGLSTAGARRQESGRWPDADWRARPVGGGPTFGFSGAHPSGCADAGSDGLVRKAVLTPAKGVYDERGGRWSLVSGDERAVSTGTAPMVESTWSMAASLAEVSRVNAPYRSG